MKEFYDNEGKRWCTIVVWNDRAFAENLENVLIVMSRVNPVVSSSHSRSDQRGPKVS